MTGALMPERPAGAGAVTDPRCWVLIAVGVADQISAGALKPCYKVPARADLAAGYAVSPLTAGRVLRLLADQGALSTSRTAATTCSPVRRKPLTPRSGGCSGQERTLRQPQSGGRERRPRWRA